MTQYLKIALEKVLALKRYKFLVFIAFQLFLDDTRVKNFITAFKGTFIAYLHTSFNEMNLFR